jgi:hypothetical protein
MVPRLSGGRYRWTMRTDPSNIYTMDGKTIVSFRRERDCEMFARALESHHRANRVYPEFSQEFTILERLESLSVISIDRWNSDELVTFCMTNFFNILDIEKMVNYKMSGNIIRYDQHPIEMCIDHLEKKL